KLLPSTAAWVARHPSSVQQCVYDNKAGAVRHVSNAKFSSVTCQGLLRAGFLCVCFGRLSFIGRCFHGGSGLSVLGRCFGVAGWLVFGGVFPFGFRLVGGLVAGGRLGRLSAGKLD